VSSSTSSSERLPAPIAPAPPRPRRALAIAGALLLVFVVVELGTARLLIPASKDLQRFDRYPARARALVAAPGKHVALLGNSATEDGVDLGLLERSLSASLSQPFVVDAFLADSAEIRTVYWMAERQLFRQGLAPELLLVTYFNHGVDDAGELDVGRLARFLTRPSDWAEVFRVDVTQLDERVDWILSSYSAVFATRNRIKERILELIPGYKDSYRQVNAVNFAHQMATVGTVTHRGLERFVRKVRGRGVQVCFVAYPTQKVYPIPDEVRRTVDAAGMLFLDLRRVDGLRPEHYADEIHLNEQGRPIYTQALARALTAVWH
jgi:hypothetical protein